MTDLYSHGYEDEITEDQWREMQVDAETYDWMRREAMEAEETAIESKLREFRQAQGFVCPSEFWPALGYRGTARYIAIWWEQCGDEAAYGDGMQSFVGAEWPAYLKLIQHNFPPGHPANWLLGASETPATMRLVIDRETERAWLVPVEEAEVTLKMQWPVADTAADFSFESLMEVIEHMAAMLPPAPSVGEIEAMLDASAARHAALEAALLARKPTRCTVCDGTGWMTYPHPGGAGAFGAAECPCEACIQDGACPACHAALVDNGPVRICPCCGFVFDEAARLQVK